MAFPRMKTYELCPGLIDPRGIGFERD